MAATFVPEIKALLCASAMETLRSTAARALRCRTAGEAATVLEGAVSAARRRVQAAHA
jgi:phosphoenolpyruvate-protein kinase (PTS system EI component)